MIELCLLLLCVGVQSQRPPPIDHGASPAVSPDGASIAFVSNRTGQAQVFVIDADGQHERQVTHAAASVGGVQWSADGRHLRYSAFADGATRIVVVDPDGSHQADFLTVPGRGPSISADEQRVVYGGGTSWTATALTVADIRAGATTSPRLINDGTSVAWNARWSPDGKTIAFTGRDANNLLQVFVVAADGTGRRQLTHHAAADGNAQVPAWSPDGQWIAYQSNSAGGHAELWVMRADGRDAHPVSAHTEAYLDETPSWFSNGTRIAFQSNRTGRMEIWAVDIDGSHLAPITK